MAPLSAGMVSQGMTGAEGLRGSIMVAMASCVCVGVGPEAPAAAPQHDENKILNDGKAGQGGQGGQGQETGE